MRLFQLVLIASVALLASASDEPPSSAVDDPEPAAEAAAEAAEPAGEEEEAVEEAAVEEEEPAAAAAAPAAAASSSASMQWVITAKMKSQLKELGYGAAEVAKLDAERAAAIIEKGIKRPGSGVPAGWSKAGKSRTAVRSSGGLMGAVRKVPTAALAPAAALLLGGVGLLAKGGGGGGKAAAAAVAAALVEEPEALPEVVPSSELWLDRQIDKLIALLKSALKLA